jgi:outer membrane PBP1 activator LpoA protein
MMSSNKKAASIALVIAVLLAASLLAASCGSSSTTGTTVQPNTKLTGNATIDTYLKELDQQMDSVSPDYFSDSQLSNSALGQ